MQCTAEKETYAAFLEKVKRTVYLDNLSPKVTESEVRMALEQFGNVKTLTFIPNYIEPAMCNASCALVEMEKQEEATAVVSRIGKSPFIISGMPRPVRGRPAEVEMFDERPSHLPGTGRKIQFRWVEPNDPDFEAAQQAKHLALKHAAEASCLLKEQIGREEKLAEKQAATLEDNYKKYQMLEAVLNDKTADDLARYYYSMKD